MGALLYWYLTIVWLGIVLSSYNPLSHKFGHRRNKRDMIQPIAEDTPHGYWL